MSKERNEKCKELLKIMRKEGITGFGDNVGGYFMSVEINKPKKKCKYCGSELPES